MFYWTSNPCEQLICSNTHLCNRFHLITPFQLCGILAYDRHMRLAQRFNLSHWTPQLVEYSLRIAPETARVPYKQANNTIKKMHLTFWPFWWPRRCAGTVPRKSNDSPCSALQFKPLDTAIGWIFALYHPGNHQGPIQTSRIHNQRKCI